MKRLRVCVEFLEETLDQHVVGDDVIIFGIAFLIAKIQVEDIGAIKGDIGQPARLIAACPFSSCCGVMSILMPILAVTPYI
jgi:hypothetical protein